MDHIAQALDARIRELISAFGSSREQRLRDLASRDYANLFPVLHQMGDDSACAIDRLSHGRATFRHELIDPRLYQILNSLNFNLSAQGVLVSRGYDCVYYIPIPLRGKRGNVRYNIGHDTWVGVIFINEYELLIADALSRLTGHGIHNLLDDIADLLQGHPDLMDIAAIRQHPDPESRLMDRYMRLLGEPAFLSLIGEHEAYFLRLFAAVIDLFDADLSPSARELPPPISAFEAVIRQWAHSHGTQHALADASSHELHADCLKGYLAGLLSHEFYHLYADHGASEKPAPLMLDYWPGRASRRVRPLMYELEADCDFVAYLQTLPHPLSTWPVFLGFLVGRITDLFLSYLRVYCHLGRDITSFEAWLSSIAFEAVEPKLTHAFFDSHPTAQERSGMLPVIAALFFKGDDATISHWISAGGMFWIAAAYSEQALLADRWGSQHLRPALSGRHPLIGSDPFLDRLKTFDGLPEEQKARLQAAWEQSAHGALTRAAASDDAQALDQALADLLRQANGGKA